MPTESTDEMRERAYRICRDYLHGTWKLVSPNDIVFKQISGGLSNLLYYCALPSSQPPKGHEPSEVLLRIYGQVHGEGALESVLAESVIFALLSERKLGPKLYGVFPGGRLEQYIPARSLLTAELADPNISAVISTKVAQLHALNVPISKEPSWLWDSMEKWLKSGKEFFSKNSSVEGVDSSVIEKLKAFDYDKEMNYLRRVINKTQSPVVFAHNDLQEGNILLSKEAKNWLDRVSLIDFEYCSYNYRGFDLANHFCEFMYEYKLEVPPFFTVNKKNFPERDMQLRFIRTYLESYEAVRGRKTSSNTSSGEHSVSTTLNNLNLVDNSALSAGITLENICPYPVEEKILSEIKVFTMASHLFWGLWSIVQGQVSTIPFGYWEYALVRLEHYIEDKANLKDENLGKRKSNVICDED